MKTVISLTTIPDRIGDIGLTVASLVAQGLPVYVWAVAKIARSETKLTRVPKFEGAHVEVVKDRGPLTKLLPALERGFDTILTADDDVIYGEGWAEGLLHWSDLLEGAVGYRGRILRNQKYSSSLIVRYSQIDKPQRVDLLTGVYGALYRKEFFNDSFLEEWKLWPSNDDLVTTAHLQKRGIKRYVIPGKIKIYPSVIQHIMPLYLLNRNRDDKLNDIGISRLEIKGEL